MYDLLSNFFKNKIYKIGDKIRFIISSKIFKSKNFVKQKKVPKMNNEKKKYFKFIKISTGFIW